MDRKKCKNNEKKRKFVDSVNNIEKPKIDNVREKRSNDNNPNVSTYEKHANVVIGPRNVGKIITCSKC